MSGEFVRERLPEAQAYFEAQGLKLKGRGKWRTAACRFHGGSDSMRINIKSGAWICMNCGAKGGDVLAYDLEMHGGSFVDAARRLGAWGETARAGRPAVRPLPFPARAGLEVLEHEALIAWMAAHNVVSGMSLTQEDLQRLTVAMQRIATVREAVA